MKAKIVFNNDPSVGIMSEDFIAEIPDISEDLFGRERLRAMLIDFYEILNGEDFSCKVYFDDEFEFNN